MIIKNKPGLSNVSAHGIFDKSSIDFIDTMKDLKMDTTQMNFIIIRKIMDITIRTSNFIFFYRNKQW